MEALSEQKHITDVWYPEEDGQLGNNIPLDDNDLYFIASDDGDGGDGDGGEKKAGEEDEEDVDDEDDDDDGEKKARTSNNMTSEFTVRDGAPRTGILLSESQITHRPGGAVSGESNETLANSRSSRSRGL
jgi:hypothetical protein